MGGSVGGEEKMRGEVKAKEKEKSGGVKRVGSWTVGRSKYRRREVRRASGRAGGEKR
jgi:hypothetical protein